jgi:hypothetical protein
MYEVDVIEQHLKLLEQPLAVILGPGTKKRH